MIAGVDVVVFELAISRHTIVIDDVVRELVNSTAVNQSDMNNQNAPTRSRSLGDISLSAQPAIGVGRPTPSRARRPVQSTQWPIDATRCNPMQQTDSRTGPGCHTPTLDGPVVAVGLYSAHFLRRVNRYEVGRPASNTDSAG